MPIDGADRARPSDTVDRYIGVQIRLRRRLAGLTQAQLACRLGLTFQQVQKYETGANRIGAARLFQVASILEVPVSVFFQEAGAAGEEAREGGDARGNPPSALSSAEAVALAQAFAAIEDAALRRRLVVLVKSIAEGCG